MFSQKELDLEEHLLREQIRLLPSADRTIYDHLEIPRLKLAAVYIRLNLLFPLGAHHFYIERWGRGLLNLLLTLSAILSATGLNPWQTPNLLVALMLLIAMIIIEVPQLINARLLVQSRNNRIMQICLSQVSQSEARRQRPGGQP